MGADHSDPQIGQEPLVVAQALGQEVGREIVEAGKVAVDDEPPIFRVGRPAGLSQVGQA